MTKIKVIDLLLILPLLYFLLCSVPSLTGSGSPPSSHHQSQTTSQSQTPSQPSHHQSQTTSQPSQHQSRSRSYDTVEVSGPDDKEPRVLSLDPYSPPSIVNDVHDRMSNHDSMPSSSDDHSSKEKSTGESSGQSKKNPLTNASEFLTLFKAKRSLQLQAVKGLVSIPKYEKRFEMVTKIFSKIFQLQEQSKSIIENSPFIPGGVNESTDPPLPTDSRTLDSLASLIENCALIGDLILRLPDITARLLDKNQPWLLLTKHCIVFTKSTRLLDPVTEKMLNLAAQELNLVPRDPDFVNPFREEIKKSNQDDEANEKSGQKKKEKKKEKKEKKEFKKGPRMSKKIEL